MVGPSVWLNAGALFIPAMIGVIGSYRLYRHRKQDQKENLRAAFLAELEGAGFLDVWPNADVPSYDFLSVSVYESNTDGFGLLTDAEVTALVHYYSRAKSVQDSLRVHSEIIANTKGTLHTDTNRRDREAGLRNGIDKLELTRQRAILMIKHARGNETLPVAGTSIGELPAQIQQDRAILLDYGLADTDPEGKLVLTQRGHDFFHGEPLLTGLDKKRDVLEREKHPLRQLAEVLWNRIRKIIRR